MPATRTRKSTTKTTTKKKSGKTTTGTSATGTRKTTKATTSRRSTRTLTHDQIAHRAFEIWLEKGQPHGQDLAIWFEAESSLRTPAKGTRTKRAA